MFKSVKQKKVLIITWFMMMITKCYTILFSTFWLLYIVKMLDGNTDQAEKIYKWVMIISIICGVGFVPLVGRLADKVNP